MASTALGVSGTLVELTGIYVGFISAFANTIMAGLAGLIAGISASISMTIASYIQAKSSSLDKPIKAAVYIGLAYITITLLLSLPHFLVS